MSKVFKERTYVCPACQLHTVRAFRWDDDPPPECWCRSSVPMEETYNTPLGQASAVHGDEIDVIIRHGMCNSDGSPKRWRSKEELKRAERARGLCVLGETPHPRDRRD